MAKVYQPTVDIARLANINVFTPDGAKLALGRVWKNQTAILIFLRHFACIACRAHASQVWAERAQYEKSGGKIIFIGNGSPQFIQTFKEDLKLEGALVLTDPTLETYRAAGFHYGFSYILRARTVVSAYKLYKEGHRQVTWTKEAGVHQQLGGVLAVSPSGRVLYHYISEYFGDLPDEPHMEIIQADEAGRTESPK